MYTAQQNIDRFAPMINYTLERLNYVFTVEQFKCEFKKDLANFLSYKNREIDFPLILVTVDDLKYFFGFNQIIENIEDFPYYNFINLVVDNTSVKLNCNVDDEFLELLIWEKVDLVKSKAVVEDNPPTSSSNLTSTKKSHRLNIPNHIPQIVHEMKTRLTKVTNEVKGKYSEDDIAVRIDIEFADLRVTSILEFNKVVLTYKLFSFTLAINHHTQFTQHPEKYTNFKININVTDSQIDMDVRYCEFQAFYVLASKNNLPDAVDRNQKLRRAIEVMNLMAVKQLLYEHISYQTMPKEKFLVILDAVFLKFRSEGNTSLNSYPGFCGFCDRSMSGYIFIGNKSEHYVSLLFDIENGGLKDLYECSSFNVKNIYPDRSKRIMIDNYDSIEISDYIQREKMKEENDEFYKLLDKYDKETSNPFS